MRIERWELILASLLTKDGKGAERLPVLVGAVYGHPTKPDGRVIRTSPITELTALTASTENSVYELGEKAHTHCLKNKA